MPIPPALALKITPLLDEFLNCADWWVSCEDASLDPVITGIVKNPGRKDLLANEREILSKIRALLDDHQWESLPALIRERRADYHQKKEEEELRLEAHKHWEMVRNARILKVDRLRTEAKRQEQERLDALRHAAEAKRGEVLASLRKRLEDDFLRADSFFEESCAGDISSEEYSREKISFVRRWVKEKTGAEPDEEQAAAIGSVNGHLLVTARAGSGKTTTLVNRAMFLIGHCGVHPDHLMLLAFNKDAAKEIRERLEKRGVQCPHVMTFHALAHALVRPAEALLMDDPEDNVGQLTRKVQAGVLHLLEQPQWHDRIRLVVTEHYKTDWSRIEHRGINLNQIDGLAKLRSMPQETLGNNRVKSFGEKLIANFLFEHDIAYGYESLRNWGEHQYRPDFTIKQHQIVIEYFGMGGAEYQLQRTQKRKYWEQEARNGWTLLEYQTSDVAAGETVFLEKLKDDLERQGVRCVRLSEDEIWSKVRRRVMEDVSEGLTLFVGRCRKQGWGPAELNLGIQSHMPLHNLEAMFLELAQEAFTIYINRLEMEMLEDFDGLMQRAIAKVREGKTAFVRKSSGPCNLARLKFLMIDEFQDFSFLFNNLIEAIRQHNPHVQLCCVGDDWQAINGFAGSDLKFFREFESRFEPATQLRISTNYRSGSTIVTLGNQIMAGHGSPARPAEGAIVGAVLTDDLDDFVCAPQEQASEIFGSPSMAAMGRVVQKVASEGRSITVLSHITPSESVRRVLTLLQEELPEAERHLIDVSTVHKYKGCEADHIILLDARENLWPMLHPGWVFNRIFGDTPESLIEAERRLFYVACTRAKSTLLLMHEPNDITPFAKSLNRQAKNEGGICAALPPVKNLDFHTDWLVECSAPVINVTLQRRGCFNDAKFRWNPQKSCWWQVYPEALVMEDVLERIQRHSWLSGPDGLRVEIAKGGICHAAYIVQDNQLHPTESRRLLTEGQKFTPTSRVAALRTRQSFPSASLRIGGLFRVIDLAKELDVAPKEILDRCKAEEITLLTSAFSPVKSGLAATIREWFQPTDEGNKE